MNVFIFPFVKGTSLLPERSVGLERRGIFWKWTSEAQLMIGKSLTSLSPLTWARAVVPLQKGQKTRISYYVVLKLDPFMGRRPAPTNLRLPLLKSPILPSIRSSLIKSTPVIALREKRS